MWWHSLAFWVGSGEREPDRFWYWKGRAGERSRSLDETSCCFANGWLGSQGHRVSSRIESLSVEQEEKDQMCLRALVGSGAGVWGKVLGEGQTGGCQWDWRNGGGEEEDQEEGPARVEEKATWEGNGAGGVWWYWGEWPEWSESAEGTLNRIWFCNGEFGVWDVAQGWWGGKGPLATCRCIVCTIDVWGVE